MTRRSADGEGVGQPHSSLHRLAPVALTALGIFGAVLMILAGLVALNHSVLPFDGWPLNDGRGATGSQVLPRAPAETGRLRTANGGTRAETNDGTVVIGGTARAGAPVIISSAAAVAPVVRLHPQHVRSRSTVPAKPAPKPAAPAPDVSVTPAAVVTAPAPMPQPTIVPTTSRLGRHMPPGRAKKLAPARAPATTLGQARKIPPGQAKKMAPPPAVVAAAPPAPAVPIAAAAPTVPDMGPGNGHGRGHAYGHYKH